MPQIQESDTIVGVVVVTPDVHGDNRGRFVETFRQEWLPAEAPSMVQGNRADRKAGALVGLHDLRASSPTDGHTLVLEIGEHDHRGVYIPPGVAHGFYALTDMTITYLVDNYYNPDDELGVAWDDPDLGVTWPRS